MIWSTALALLATGALVYLLDPHAQHFESIFMPASLREALAPVMAATSLPDGVRFWLPDFAWAMVAGLFAGEMLAGTRVPRVAASALVLLAAVSWELLQSAGLAAGVFDPVDLAVSAAAGVLASFAGLMFTARNESP